MASSNKFLEYDGNPTGPKKPNPFTTSSEIDLEQPSSPISTNPDGSLSIERPDGSVTIDINPQFAEENEDDTGVKKFDRNLALEMDDMDLSSIAAEVLDGIEADEQSRKDWLDIRSKGISMLALKIEDPASDMGTSSAPLEGMSKVRHSLLLEATVAFQAGARGELLPAAGPVKVKNAGPPSAPQGTMDGSAPLDELANALESNFNHYLTDTAREYIPDTDRMLFMIPFGGDGFKKLYHCPLRRRPVSESVDAENLIVSNAATDLASCSRITHKIKMRRSVLRRMQIMKAYRDVPLTTEPAPKPADEVAQKKAEIGGYNPNVLRQKDADYDLYESYVELDIPRFAPRRFRNKGLPLSYKVTIEATSRQILEIRRNWNEDDKECNARQVFVQFPFIRGLGFYGLGFVHLLGNAVMALTAAYRLMLDAGMMANFPGLIFDKQAGRQNNNQFRIPPGGGIGLDVPAGKRISDVVMGAPYKEVGPAFPAFIQHLEDRTKQLAMVANTMVGEGKQDAPVGSTLALLEQATKVESSAFKRLHDAQAEEFRILKDLFREDPEAMWRHSKGKITWQRAQFLMALQKYELIPVADPNNPTALHRMMKAAMLKTLAMQNPMAYDMVAVDKRIMSMANIDPQGVFRPPVPGQVDPVMMALQAKQEMERLQISLRQQEQQLKAAIAIQQAQGKAADRASKEKTEKMKLEIQRLRDQEQLILERLKLSQQAIEHWHQLASAERQGRMDMTEAERGRQHQTHESERSRQHEGHEAQIARWHESQKPPEGKVQ